MLQKAGGNFTLTADVNFGPSFGLLSQYFTTRTASPSTSGVFRLADGDSIGWRNHANSGNVLLAKDTSDNLLWNSNVVLAPPGTTYDTSGRIKFVGAGGSVGVLIGQAGGQNTTADFIIKNNDSGWIDFYTGGTYCGGFNTSQKLILQNALTVANGGTGIASGTSGGIPYFSATTTIASSALLAQYGVVLGGGAGAAPATLSPDSSTAKVLTSGGASANPTWSLVQGNATICKVPTVQKFTSGSGTYTTPSSPTPVYIRVRMVGGGGGGAGSGGTTGTAATDGGNSTFGSSLLTANGGTHGGFGNAGGGGGTASLGSGPVGVATTGGDGQGYSLFTTPANNASSIGGMGGSSPFGGAGAGGSDRLTGVAAKTNSGSGGGGAGGCVGASTYTTGSGGGAGGFVDAVIASPAASYSYAVGAAGSGGAAGTSPSGSAGGNGAAGIIIVEEFYQ
jgi:hypothetical protein